MKRNTELESLSFQVDHNAKKLPIADSKPSAKSTQEPDKKQSNFDKVAIVLYD